MTPIQLFLRGCRKRLFRLKAADSIDTQMSGGRLLTASLIMRRLLIRTSMVDSNQPMIGILLPPSVGAVLANVGVGLNKLVAVNLNYSFSSETVQHCISQCGITHVLTSRKFLTERPFKLDVTFVYLEDLLKQANWMDKLIGIAQAYCLPSFCLERVLGLQKIDPDELMAVLFTSGTTGVPKGVMLSHKNIAASVDSIAQLYKVDSHDVALGILPFFHAFGYSAILWLALTLDMAVVYHFDPFGTKVLGKLARKFKATILFATPTFLNLYVRRGDKQDFQSLELAVVGAEKLTAELAATFKEKFNATPVEGYGTTELAPWAAVNVPPQRSLEGDEHGAKAGTVGRALPGVEVKIVDPDTRNDLKTGEAGLLLVRGENVMLGYLNQPEKTAEVIQDGWYNTGDFARLDSDGFIEITGRQSRFSKIGGEIVPHARIEQLITTSICGDETPEAPVVAVTAIPDPNKGERLIVLHVPLVDLTIDELKKRLHEQGLPNLWIPRASDFLEVSQIPLTSIGKVDLGSLKRIAADARSAKSPE